ncbi:HEAT repeat domain-containing protein [Rubinisphaera brasiliensis]|uniref:HEAT repeat domain-containing protein n=1 Tax=Rubinisphaera brasiliensis TaxID=119 RepID=UPI00145D4A6C|nr:HEAT repeat domain-containing protein [Rubinisphaera brasiliensis]
MRPVSVTPTPSAPAGTSSSESFSSGGKSSENTSSGSPTSGASASGSGPGRPRRVRERPKKDAGPTTALALAIRKALKQQAPAPETLLREEDQPSPAELKKLQKTWPKTIKRCRKTLEENYDEQGRQSINAICDAFEELGQIRDEETVEILSGHLEDSRPSVRETAARSLGETKLPSAFEPLVKRLGHESTEMRAAVVHGLGLLGDRRAILPLVALAAEDPQFNIRATDALVRIGPAAIPFLIEIAEENDPSSTLIAIQALGRLKDLRALEVLANKSAHSMATIRSHAIEAIGQLGESKGVRYLVKGLSDENIGVRIQSAIALKKMGDKRAADALVQALNDPDQDVLEHVIAALGACGDKAVVPHIIPLLDSSNNEICIAAAEALGRLGDDGAVPRLCELLSNFDGDENRAVRLKVLDSLRRLKHPDAVPYMVDLLADPQPEIRERAVDVLGQIGDQSAVVDLENLLKEDRHEGVRIACAKALGEIGDPESVAVLEDALTDTVQVRLKAVIALGQIGNDSALLSLTAMLRDQLPELRYHAAQALAEIGDKRSIRPVEVLAADSDPMVSRGAFKALAKLGDERSEKEILKAAKKRTKKATTVKASKTNFKDMFSPAVLRDMFWPDDPQRRMVIAGSGGGVLLVGIVAAAMFLSSGPTKVVRRGRPVSVAFSSDGNKLVTGRSYGVVEFWDVTGDEPNYSFDYGTSEIAAVAYVSEDNIWFASGNQVQVHNGSKSTPVVTLTAKVDRMIASLDRARIAIIDKQRNVFVYNAESKAAEGSLAFPGVERLAVSPSGKQVAAVFPDKIKVFDTLATEVAEISVDKPIRCAEFTPDGTGVAIVHGKDGRISVFTIAETPVLQGEVTPEVALNPEVIRFGKSEGQIFCFGMTGAHDKPVAEVTIGSPAIKYIENAAAGIPAAFCSVTGSASFLDPDDTAIDLLDVYSGTRSELYFSDF